MKKIIAVGSGKGGVGKSTAAVNIAVALANQTYEGARPLKVALVDVDFYGPSVPVLMGAKLDGTELKVDHQEKFIAPIAHGVKYISIAFFLKKNDDAIIWRGPMFGKAISQLFQDVSWGDVDVCIVDMPPGTGDAQLSLAQGIKLAGAVLVTTPQEVALSDVRRALNMFKKVEVPVLGVIENMTGEIFGKGGGQTLAQTYGVRFLGDVPLEIGVRKGGDVGQPCVLDKDSLAGKSFSEIARNLMDEVERVGEKRVVIED